MRVSVEIEGEAHVTKCQGQTGRIRDDNDDDGDDDGDDVYALLIFLNHNNKIGDDIITPQVGV